MMSDSFIGGRLLTASECSNDFGKHQKFHRWRGGWLLLLPLLLRARRADTQVKNKLDSETWETA